MAPKRCTSSSRGACATARSVVRPSAASPCAVFVLGCCGEEHSECLGVACGNGLGAGVGRRLESLPLREVLGAPDILVAYGLNGSPLPREHGFPALT